MKCHRSKICTFEAQKYAELKYTSQTTSSLLGDLLRTMTTNLPSSINTLFPTCSAAITSGWGKDYFGRKRRKEEEVRERKENTNTKSKNLNFKNIGSMCYSNCFKVTGGGKPTLTTLVSSPSKSSFKSKV
jgi:hypothetical protein